MRLKPGNVYKLKDFHTSFHAIIAPRPFSEYGRGTKTAAAVMDILLLEHSNNGSEPTPTPSLCRLVMTIGMSDRLQNALMDGLSIRHGDFDQHVFRLDVILNHKGAVWGIDADVVRKTTHNERTITAWPRHKWPMHRHTPRPW